MGGGGSTLNVVGRNTGAQAQFTTPGTRPLVNGIAAGTDVFQIANDSTLTGLDITGGNDGVFGDSVTGFTLRDLNISGAAEDGVSLDRTNSGDIRNVVSNLNGGDGFFVDTFNGGTISGNTASGNVDGFLVVNFNDGAISGNTASGNGTRGFFVSNFNDGTISENTASGNSLHGFPCLVGPLPGRRFRHASVADDLPQHEKRWQPSTKK